MHATLMWSTGRIESPLSAFVGKFSIKVVSIPFFDILAELFFCIINISTINC